MTLKILKAKLHQATVTAGRLTYHGSLTLDPELMGPLAAIGIVKGQPFAPDARMKKILGEITSGEFTKEFIGDYKAGSPNFNALRAKGKAHPIEKTGAELRAMMPWISAGKQKVEDAAGGSN